MEYIHKAKAEKSRTKVLNDQMEARRTKNKVPYFTIPGDRKVASLFPFRLPGNVALKELRRRGKRSWLWKMHLQRSKYSSYDPLSHVPVTVVRYVSHAPANLRIRAFHRLSGPRISIRLYDFQTRKAPICSPRRPQAVKSPYHHPLPCCLILSRPYIRHLARCHV